MNRRDAKLVYTSDPEEARRQRESTGQSALSLPHEKQTIRVSLDRKRRRGKTVTVARGFALQPPSLAKIEQQLKQKCGAGGTSTAQEIEIQGDHISSVAMFLEQLGFKVRKI
ncbi:MAG: translation initiation factor [Acidobacteriota bacterium]